MSAARVEAVAIGASAGAVGALSRILPALPAELGLPILVVVHVPQDRRSGMGDFFSGICPMEVREPDDKDSIQPGTIYFAPPDYHMLVDAGRCISLSTEEPVQFSRPSIDVLFESAADAYGAALLGVVLTGANNDGAVGLKAIMDAGGTGLVEDPAEASSPMMPQAALAMCPTARPLSLDAIVSCLLELERR